MVYWKVKRFEWNDERLSKETFYRASRKKVEGIGSDEEQFKCGMETEDHPKEDAERMCLS